MGLLTFGINVTLDGCIDHQEGIADDETHAFFTRLMDEGGAMLWGRVTYEMMESDRPAVARGEEEAPPAIREWAVKLEAKPKYVVSSTRTDFPWTNSHHIAGDLRTGVQKLKDATPAGVLLGSGKLATELDRLDLIDEYRFLVHPRIAGHGPTLYRPRHRGAAAGVQGDRPNQGALSGHEVDTRRQERAADIADGGDVALVRRPGRREVAELGLAGIAARDRRCPLPSISATKRSPSRTKTIRPGHRVPGRATDGNRLATASAATVMTRAARTSSHANRRSLRTRQRPPRTPLRVPDAIAVLTVRTGSIGLAAGSV